MCHRRTQVQTIIRLAQKGPLPKGVRLEGEGLRSFLLMWLDLEQSLETEAALEQQRLQAQMEKAALQRMMGRSTGEIRRSSQGEVRRAPSFPPHPCPSSHTPGVGDTGTRTHMCAPRNAPRTTPHVFMWRLHGVERKRPRRVHRVLSQVSDGREPTRLRKLREVAR